MTPEQIVLNELLTNATPNSLWCADENVIGFQPSQFLGTILTNRFKPSTSITPNDSTVIFNDFNFNQLQHHYNTVFFRIAKEKLLNLHIIKECALHGLKTGECTLFLLGYKNEGIDSLARLIEAEMNTHIIVHKYKAQLRCLEIQFNQNCTSSEDNYHALTLIKDHSFAFYSKPGVFGWNKIDKGSELLMDCVQAHYVTFDKPFNILDLACGYGYLSLRARQMGAKQIDASDNNAAAIIACTENFKNFDISGDIFADDCARHCNNRYDIILCNPPFHQGFEHHKSLMTGFLKEIARLLKTKGEAWIVVNQFIGIEAIAAAFFTKIEQIDKKEGFKVILLKK